MRGHAALCPSNVIYHFSGKAVLKPVGNEIIIRNFLYTKIRSFPISISSCSLYSVSPDLVSLQLFDRADSYRYGLALQARQSPAAVLPAIGGV